MVYTHSAPQAHGVMGWGSARELSPGGTAVSKATPAHRGGTPEVWEGVREGASPWGCYPPVCGLVLPWSPLSWLLSKWTLIAGFWFGPNGWLQVLDWHWCCSGFVLLKICVAQDLWCLGSALLRICVLTICVAHDLLRVGSVSLKVCGA